MLLRETILKILILSLFMNLIAAEFLTDNPSLTYLQEEKNSTNRLYNQDVDPSRISKVIRILDNFYELDSYINSKENQNYLVIKVKRENSDSEVYSYEGTFEQIIKFDSEWKVFKSLEQIFTKIIKVKVLEEKFNFAFEGSELIVQFVVDILGDSISLKIKLLKASDPTDDNVDLKKVTEQISLMKAKLENLEKQLYSKEQQIVSFITRIQKDTNNNYYFTYLKDGDSFEFDFDVSYSGQIKIAYEFECSTANSVNTAPSVIGILLELTSKTDSKKKLEFTLHNQQYFFYSSYNHIPEGSVLSVKNSRNIDILKGSYSGTVKFFGGRQVGNGVYSSECGRLIVKRINLL